MPAWMETFVREAHLANLALLVLGIEAAALLALRRRLAGMTLGLMLNVATGVVLMLIVRAALLGRPAMEIAALFVVSGLLHGADMWLRLRRA